MLELAILGLLVEQDLHGYEVKRQLVETPGFTASASFGSIYPALRRLERDGAIEAQAAVPDGPAPVLATRKRKVYSITATGRRLFQDLLLRDGLSPEDDRSFSLKLALARYLPPGDRLSLLEQRKATLGQRLARLAAPRHGTNGPIDRYRRSLAEREADTLREDISWLEGLILDERTGAGESAGSTSASVGSSAASSAEPRYERPKRSWLSPLTSAAQLQRHHAFVTTSTPGRSAEPAGRNGADAALASRDPAPEHEPGAALAREESNP